MLDDKLATKSIIKPLCNQDFDLGKVRGRISKKRFWEKFSFFSSILEDAGYKVFSRQGSELTGLSSTITIRARNSRQGAFAIEKYAREIAEQIGFNYFELYVPNPRGKYLSFVFKKN